MAISVVKSGDSVTITLDEKFDYNSVEDFRDAYLANEGTRYKVDFFNTNYMDSSGLGMLLNMLRHLNEDSSRIEIINCKPQVKRIFSIARFDSKFSIS